ncbi:MAG: hypothetical protein OK438_05970 [Thaumarchaeota archaeon]|nr:hypothetical protein [Nitrososphaerota archaeon]
MALELWTVLLGVSVGAVAVLYAAPKGYLGHRRKKESSTSVTSLESYTPATEQVVEVPAPETPAAVEPVPFSAPALYESVQPAPAPVTYPSSSVTSFGAPSISKKPTRTYRRRTAPVRSTAGSKATLKAKPKKR